MIFDSDQLTLTCISTGGPATSVTWTRDNVNITGEQNETVLNDTVTAQYTHTLTVTAAGVYTCTVSNNKPSSATSASITVPGDNLPEHQKCFMFFHEKLYRSISESLGPPAPLFVELIVSSHDYTSMLWLKK